MDGVATNVGPGASALVLLLVHVPVFPLDGQLDSWFTLYSILVVLPRSGSWMGGLISFGRGSLVTLCGRRTPAVATAYSPPGSRSRSRIWRSEMVTLVPEFPVYVRYAVSRDDMLLCWRSVAEYYS
ncbi:uncharacterized protein P884DRAFT_80694 [Thermothelomyces heterothallicus CBS 202.75]|uniref:uncharacterized protein n=1 Tax=Thermothelomyces heterothallicus CBS 202.75 TaxID=1149848 RepID=UPI003744AE18